MRSRALYLSANQMDSVPVGRSNARESCQLFSQENLSTLKHSTKIRSRKHLQTTIGCHNLRQLPRIAANCAVRRAVLASSSAPKTQKTFILRCGRLDVALPYKAIYPIVSCNSHSRQASAATLRCSNCSLFQSTATGRSPPALNGIILNDRQYFERLISSDRRGRA